MKGLVIKKGCECVNKKSCMFKLHRGLHTVVNARLQCENMDGGGSMGNEHFW